MSASTASPAGTANAASVQAIYEAFGRGDIPAILDRLADDVRWEHWSDSFLHRAGVPWMRPRTGHAAVVEFFELVGTWEIARFDVLDLMASGSQVAAEVVIESLHRSGGRFRDEELHLWSFDADGKVSRMRHYVDTAKHIAAARGEDTTAS